MTKDFSAQGQEFIEYYFYIYLVSLCLQWPAGDQKEENDIEEEESEDEEVENERKSDFNDLYGINYWNYESLDN